MFWWRSLSSVAYDQGWRGCFDDVICDGRKLVDLYYRDDLGEESFEEPEMPRMIRSIAAIAWASMKSPAQS